jgi:hypothetical protein
VQIKAKDGEYRILPCRTEEYLSCFISMEALRWEPYSLELGDTINIKATVFNNGITVEEKDDSLTVIEAPTAIPFDITASLHSETVLKLTWSIDPESSYESFAIT